jgi:hypothetical protein
MLLQGLRGRRASIKFCQILGEIKGRFRLEASVILRRARRTQGTKNDCRNQETFHVGAKYGVGKSQPIT